MSNETLTFEYESGTTVELVKYANTSAYIYVDGDLEGILHGSELAEFIAKKTASREALA